MLLHIHKHRKNDEIVHGNLIRCHKIYTGAPLDAFPARQLVGDILRSNCIIKPTIRIEPYKTGISMDDYVVVSRPDLLNQACADASPTKIRGNEQMNQHGAVTQPLSIHRGPDHGVTSGRLHPDGREKASTFGRGLNQRSRARVYGCLTKTKQLRIGKLMTRVLFYMGIYDFHMAIITYVAGGIYIINNYKL